MTIAEHYWGVPILTDEQFQKLSVFVYEACGIRLTSAKKTMLTSRLVGRLRALSMDNFDDYYAHITHERGRAEITRMIDVVSTNKTCFFREDSHFSVLTQVVLPRLIDEQVLSHNRLQIWSAGCSSGEEPYTMAMVLSEYATQCPGFDFQVFASDISTRILSHAKAGIYKNRKIEEIPQELVRRYMLKGSGGNIGNHRIVPELQRKVSFQRVNFTHETFPMSTMFDVIFCRNVIIYFDKKTQVRLFEKFYEHLKPGGFFFIGHSEMVPIVNKQFEKVEPTVYQKV